MIETCLAIKVLNANPEKDLRNSIYRWIFSKLAYFESVNNLEDFKNLSSSILTYANRIKELERQSSQEYAKLSNLPQSMNEILEELGIHGLKISTSTNNEDLGWLIEYPNLEDSNAKVVPGLRHSLSEGELTSLAFAFFIFKLKSENMDLELDESSIVIDDPVSSLDEDRVIQTALAIRNKFKEYGQVIVFSHDLKFLKHLYKILHTGDINTRCKYLQKDTIVDFPKVFGSFETTYYYMLGELLRFKHEKISERSFEQKAIIPNYCRRVLESFMIFKLAKLQKGNSKLTPGLKDWKKEDFKSYLSESDTDRLLMLLKDLGCITDPSSHGNFSFNIDSMEIPKGGEGRMVDMVLDVIETLDQVHLKSSEELVKIAQDNQI